MHPTNRGVALYGDKVFVTATDACAVALDAATGEEIWETCVADWEAGFHMTLAPLPIRGKIIMGVSGAEFGARCFAVALDAETGEPLWDFQAGAAVRTGPMSYEIDGQQRIVTSAGGVMLVFGLD